MKGLLVFALFVAHALCASDCNSCSVNTTVFMSVCTNQGTDLQVSPGTSTCYFRCNVSAVYAGTCKCPNQCYNGGTCSSSGCACVGEWSGADCSLKSKCTSNSCNGRGDCDIAPDQFVVCTCNLGWTGPYCDQPAVEIPYPAFSPVFSNDPPVYSKTDQYGDDHPILNSSAVAVIRLSMDPKQYLELINPANAYPGLKKEAKFVFSASGPGAFQGVGIISLQGSYSRRFMKKGYKLTFEGQDFFGLDELVLKCSQDDPTFMRGRLSMDLSRSMGLAVQRLGFTKLWINNVYMGFYTMQENIDKNWVSSRFDYNKIGLVKARSRCTLAFNGTSPSDYNWHRYLVKEGDTNFTQDSLVDLIHFINASDVNQFLNSAPTNLDLILRYMVVEYFISDTDGYSQFGNNYFFLFNGTNSTFIPYDQEDGYGGTANVTFWAERSLFDFFVNCSSVSLHRCTPHPLTFRLFFERFDAVTLYLQTFLSSLFANSAVSSRVNLYAKVISANLENDNLYGIDFKGYNGEVSSYVNYVNIMQTYLQLKSFLASRKMKKF